MGLSYYLTLGEGAKHVATFAPFVRDLDRVEERALETIEKAPGAPFVESLQQTLSSSPRSTLVSASRP